MSDINKLFHIFFNQENYKHPLCSYLREPDSEKMVLWSPNCPVVRVSTFFDLDTKEKIFTPLQISAINNISLPNAYWYSELGTYKLAPREFKLPKNGISLFYSYEKKLNEVIDIKKTLDRYSKIIAEQKDRENNRSNISNEIISFKLFGILEEMQRYLNSPEVANYVENQMFNKFLGITNENS